MRFFAMARIYRHPDDAISLRDVWTIGEGELNEAAGGAWLRVRAEAELSALHREVAWSAQALIEFADLANFTHSGFALVKRTDWRVATGRRSSLWNPSVRFKLASGRPRKQCLADPVSRVFGVDRAGPFHGDRAHSEDDC